MRDIVGAGLSVLCMIHCFLPLIAISVGAGVGIHQVAEHMHHDWMHMGLLLPIILLLAYSLPAAYIQHKNIKPTIFASVGLLILVTAIAVGGQLETPITVLGSIFVIGAHLYNRRKLKFIPV